MIQIKYLISRTSGILCVLWIRHSLCALCALDPTQASDNIHTTFLSYDHKYLFNIMYYIIIRVRSAFSLVVSCVLLKYTHTNDVN